MFLSISMIICLYMYIYSIYYICLYMFCSQNASLCAYEAPSDSPPCPFSSSYVHEASLLQSIAPGFSCFLIILNFTYHLRVAFLAHCFHQTSPSGPLSHIAELQLLKHPKRSPVPIQPWASAPLKLPAMWTLKHVIWLCTLMIPATLA